MGEFVTTTPVNVGSAPNDGAGASLRDGGETFNANIAALDTAVNALALSQTAGQIGFADKATMTADLAHADGTLALVTNDATPANNGTYRKSGASGSGNWVLSADRVTALAGSVGRLSYERDYTQPLVEAAFAHQNIFDKDDPGVTAGYAVSNVTGGLNANASYTATGFMRVEPGAQYRVKRAWFIAYYDEDRAYVSGDPVNGTANYQITVPAGAYWMRASINPTTVALSAYMVTPGTAIPSAYVPYSAVAFETGLIPGFDVLVENVDAMVAAGSAYAEQSITVVDGYYINRNTGAVTASASYRYALIALAEGESWAASAKVSGTSVALAVYYGEGDVYLGKEYDGTGTTVNVVDYVLSPPAGTVKIGLCGRIEGDLVAKKLTPIDVEASLADLQNQIDLLTGEASTWSGLTIDVMGDSNVQQNKWQPAVAADLGCTLLNHGVSGSKIAKPDSAVDQVSMCDDARIAALSSTADAYMVLGGTNDWAQNIPLGAITDAVDTTFYGALIIMIEKILTLYPDKPLFLATTLFGMYSAGRYPTWTDGQINAQGLKTSDYAEAVRQVGKRYGLPVVDAHAENGINEFNVTTFLNEDAATAPVDGYAYIHFNTTTGAARMSLRVADRLRMLQPLRS